MKDIFYLISLYFLSRWVNKFDLILKQGYSWCLEYTWPICVSIAQILFIYIPSYNILANSLLAIYASVVLVKLETK